MIIAQIIRSDCNLIKLGKDWLPLRIPCTTLRTEYRMHKNNTSRLQASALNDLRTNHFTTQSGNRQN